MSLAEPYEFIQGTAPLLISIPHAGTHLTPEVASGLDRCCAAAV